MTTLEDLYYGNISPYERYIKRGTRVDKPVKLICKNYVDWSLYGIEGEENYYTANVREAIGKGNWGGTADEIAYSIANGFRNSKGHWSYVGSFKYTYMAVGVMYDGYYMISSTFSIYLFRVMLLR